MRLRTTLLAATMLALATPALAGPTEDFQKLQDDYWAATLRTRRPWRAGRGSRTMTAARRSEPCRDGSASGGGGGFPGAAKCNPGRSLPAAEQANQAILKRKLEDAVEAQPLRPAAAALFDARQLSRHLRRHGRASAVPHAADYDNYLARLALVPERMRLWRDQRQGGARGLSSSPALLTNFRRDHHRYHGDPANRASMRRSPAAPARYPTPQWRRFSARGGADPRPSQPGLPGLSPTAYDTQLAGNAARRSASRPCRRARNITPSRSASRRPPT